MISDKELVEYNTHKKYSSFHHVDGLESIVNSPEVLLNPLDGMNYSFIANSPEDVIKFIYRFTDISVFENYLITIENGENSLAFTEDEDPPDCKFLPERHFTKVSFNGYFDVDRQVEKVFYPDQVCEQLHPSEVKVLPHIEYPCAIQWKGEDSFDRIGGMEVRLCTIIPLTRTHFIQVS